MHAKGGGVIHRKNKLENREDGEIKSLEELKRMATQQRGLRIAE